MFSVQVAAEISTVNLYQLSESVPPNKLKLSKLIASLCDEKRKSFWQQDIEEIKRFADVGNFTLHVCATREDEKTSKRIFRKSYFIIIDPLSVEGKRSGKRLG
jgi:hypothetical protein